MKKQMKKFLFLGALAAMLLGTASCSNEMEPEMTDGTVQFKVELPGNFESRAIADGTTATKLEVACYDANGVKLPVEPTVKTDFVNREATVTYKLVKGQKYNFAFFAHADGAPYTFTPGANMAGCKFDVNYTGACNDEKRDAFYAVLKDYSVTTAETTVTLYRPFAQLNFGADDLAAASAAGITPSQSMVTVKKAATSFGLFTEETDGEVDVEYTLANLPNDPPTLSVEGTNYAWMEMCYFLVPDNEANVDVKMTVKTNKADVEVPVANVPVKKNHRTNIVGSLFTQEGKFNVIIDQNFDTPDYNVEPVNPILVSTEEELKAALNGSENKNIYIKLLNDVQLSYGARVAYGNANTESITIDGDGHTLNLKGTDSDWSSFGILGNGNLILKNMTVNKTEPGNGAWNNHCINLSNKLENGHDPVGSGKIIVSNVVFNNSVAFSNDAEFDGCTFNEAGGYYTLIIRANVQNTTIKNCSFNATNGRGIKVMDEYLVTYTKENGKIISWTPKDGSEVVQCKINVSNCNFNTAKKAAILVSNVKGANITIRDLDITNTVDPNHAVWVDEDWSNYADQVIVDPQSTCIVEQ